MLIHELGHATIGTKLGLRLHSFAVWPFALRRSGISWRLTRGSFHSDEIYGFAAMYALDSTRLRMRFFLSTAAGPVFSIAGGAVSVLLADVLLPRLSPGLAAFLGAVGIWSLALGLMSLIPFSRDGFTSDGYALLRFAREGVGLRRLYAVVSLLLSAEELRPREWDAGLIELALSGEVEASPWIDIEPLLNYARYQRYADTGDAERARQALVWILNHDLPAAQRLTWEWEAVWFNAFSLRDPQAARDRERIAESLTPDCAPHSEVWKAKAEIAACEGRLDDAKVAAANALACIASEKNYPAALARALRSDLAEIIGASVSCDSDYSLASTRTDIRAVQRVLANPDPTR